ncbi:MAG: FKBP-type peptidyl-prolyl cis-trans isomerase [Sorangiineae bacterium]|nr:FKBP-type peptidyl-prolyl cis-trans isomerase [Polyangiaceae bacterium]MEB2322689.1 FKBP-type peptidyl-prolyl cis-trans isomerase [Sorangiineae bacterium]
MSHGKWIVALGLVAALGACKSGDDTPASGEPSETPPSSVPSSRALRMPGQAPPAMTATPVAPASIPAPPDVAAPPADAQKTASGLATKVLTKGTGTAHPGENDRVEVNYTGWTTDGKMFDSSVTRGQPASFGVGQVIRGWTEGLELMVEGEKRRFWIPAALAYGDRPRGGAPSGALTFDVELLRIIPAPKPPEVPADVKAPPKDAKKTASGLAYKVITKGKGKRHPAATDRVTVNYSGWTTDGKMFDSSVTRGVPATFSLNQVIKGWTEGVQLMTEGEKVRFWIPGKLAYGDEPRPGRPSGMLVFDIELITIQ